jgi:hypothetical protein
MSLLNFVEINMVVLLKKLFFDTALLPDFFQYAKSSSTSEYILFP